MNVESMIIRLASRGFVPHEHNLTIWQHADGSGWGVGIESGHESIDVAAHGDTLQLALETLMRNTGRGADLSFQDK